MIARHDLPHSKTWRGLLTPALDTARRLVAAQAVLAIQRPAQPDLHRRQYVTMKTCRTPARAREAYKVASATDWDMISLSLRTRSA